MVQGFQHFDASRDSWFKDVRSYDSLIGVPAQVVYDLFKELGLLGKKIGLELGYEQRIFMPYNDFEKIRQTLHTCDLVDASGLIWTQRMIKSEAEVIAHQRACEIGNKAFLACFRETEAGMTEKEVARILGRTIFEEGGEQGFCIVISGPGNYGRVAGMPTDRVLQKGDLMWIDLGVIANGCWCDFCRAGVVGGPTAEQRRMQDLISKITLKTADYVRPGIKSSDLSKYCIDLATKQGIDFTFNCGRLGHAMGFNSTEPPHIALYDDTVLEPGMIFTLEPGVVNDIGTFIVEENLVVRPDGYELLTTTQRELFTIP
jgi:Xaa-Pro aminopeptidase